MIVVKKRKLKVKGTTNCDYCGLPIFDDFIVVMTTLNTDRYLRFHKECIEEFIKSLHPDK